MLILYKKSAIGATRTRRPQGVLYPSATAAHDAAIAQRLRELERQFRLGAFERAVLTPPKLSPVLREIHSEAVAQAFKDAYSLVFPRPAHRPHRSRRRERVVPAVCRGHGVCVDAGAAERRGDGLRAG